MENVVTDLSPQNTPRQFHVIMGKLYQIFQRVIDSIIFFVIQLFQIVAKKPKNKQRISIHSIRLA